jgi:hypothetical protein
MVKVMLGKLLVYPLLNGVRISVPFKQGDGLGVAPDFSFANIGFVHGFIFGIHVRYRYSPQATEKISQLRGGLFVASDSELVPSHNGLCG